MQSDELRALQAPLKERYRTAPEEAVITLSATGALDEHAVSCRVDTGRALVEAGLHPATGGSGLLACSGDLLLQALVACAGVTLRAVATALAIPVRGRGAAGFAGAAARTLLCRAADAPDPGRAERPALDLTAAGAAAGPRPRPQAAAGSGPSA